MGFSTDEDEDHFYRLPRSRPRRIQLPESGRGVAVTPPFDTSLKLDTQARLERPAGAQIQHARLFRYLARWRVSLLAASFDVTGIVFVAELTYPGARQAGAFGIPAYLAGATGISLLCCAWFQHAELYKIDILVDSIQAIKSLFAGWTMMFLLLATLELMLKQPDLSSRRWLVEFYAGGIVALGCGRWMFAQLVKSWIARGHITKTVAVVGANDLTAELLRRLNGNRFGIRVIGVFEERLRDKTTEIAGVKRLGQIEDLLRFAQTEPIDLVVITLPITATDRITAVIRKLRRQPFNIRVLPGAIALDRISHIRLGRTELPGIQLIAVTDRPLSDAALIIKSAFDRLAAVFGLILLSPLLLVCAAGIKISSPGPVFFRQVRVGYKGREFMIVKFRTMHVGSVPHTELTKRQDPRVFLFGSWLRKCSLDEVPQLFNVLKGDMSLVGPRPHMPQARAASKLYNEAVAEYADRQRVKPGITGWAQVNGWRGPTETIEQIERRVDHDIYYIENWSLILDLVILVRTLLVGLSGRNAF
jgi:Undecaprenyl-phosphate glucose phosphotransferase